VGVLQNGPEVCAQQTSDYHTVTEITKNILWYHILKEHLRFTDGAGNTVEENSSIFFLI